MGGVLRGLLGVLIYFGTLLFYVLRYLLFAVACGAAFGGAIYLASLKFTDPGSITRGLMDAAAILCPPIMVYTIIRDKLRSMGRSAGTHGSARFASGPELLWLGGPSGLLIGRNLQSGKPLRYDGPGHLLTIAPTRTGKGVGTVIPNLLVADRSVICVDPKGENTTITARARARFGAVHVLDPFGITGQPSACFNPLAALKPASLDLAEDAATLADALVFDAPGEAGEAHWNEEAKALIGGILLHILTEEPPARRTLAVLREHLTSATAAFEVLLTEMQASAAAGGLVARAANRHLGKADREATGVLSAAQRHTHFLDSPRMTAVLDHSDFSFADLKARTRTVFLVLPPDRLST